MDYDDEKKEKLDNLERKLYSRNAPDIIENKNPKKPLASSDRGEIHEEIKESWEKGPESSSFDEVAAKVSKMAQKKHTFVKKIFIFSVAFFVVAAGIATFVFLDGMNLVSSKNVNIKIVGPLSVGGGQEVSFDVNIINNNNIDLDSASLLIEYPTGTRSSADLTKELDQERFDLGKISSGENYNQKLKVVFFGKKEEIKKIKLSLEYRVKNSSALFYKEKTYEVSISSAPIIITPTYPKEVTSNQDISFDIEVASNSEDKIGDFLVRVEYPFGFVFKESSPPTTFDDNVWRFSGLNPGDKKNIKIEGNIIGQNNEERVFKIGVGTASEDDERMIAVPLSELTESVLIKKSFIGMDIFIGGKRGDFAGKGGNQVNTELVVRNNLPGVLFNTSVEVALKGGAFNQLSVKPSNNGFFQSSNNTILWDKRAVPDFSELSPGAEERLSFRLSPLLYANIASGAKPEIEMTITSKGERVLDSGSVENVSAIEKRKIVLATDLALSSKVVRAIGNIENSGPVPPKADTPTTYTVVWDITNSFNQVSNVEVRATLPSYVKWTNVKYPSSEIFSFNPVTNEVVWDVGSVLSNTGFGSTKKEVQFQLELLPSTSQIGQSPTLMGAATLSGIDKITDLKVNSSAQAVTTDFLGDPSYKQGDGRVVQ